MSNSSISENLPLAARRRLLLVIAAGGTAHLALPDRWSKPVIESVLLPAHAQTTATLSDDECPSTLIASTPSSVTARTADEPPEDFDNVDIIFDGCGNLALAVTDSEENLGGPDADIILSLDVDTWFNDVTIPQFGTFDVTHLGGPRWDVESDDFGGDSNLPGGTYTLTVLRTVGANAGRRFEITLTVEVTTVDEQHQQIELSGVTANPL